jgi:hypothetical protein
MKSDGVHLISSRESSSRQWRDPVSGKNRDNVAETASGEMTWKGSLSGELADFE